MKMQAIEPLTRPQLLRMTPSPLVHLLSHELGAQQDPPAARAAWLRLYWEIVRKPRRQSQLKPAFLEPRLRGPASLSSSSFSEIGSTAPSRSRLFQRYTPLANWGANVKEWELNRRRRRRDRGFFAGLIHRRLPTK